MKCKTELEVISSRPYNFKDKNTGEPVYVVEIVFRDEDNRLYKVSRRGTVAIEEGKYEVTLNIVPNEKLVPTVGVIEW